MHESSREEQKKSFTMSGWAVALVNLRSWKNKTSSEENCWIGPVGAATTKQRVLQH